MALAVWSQECWAVLAFDGLQLSRMGPEQAPGHGCDLGELNGLDGVLRVVHTSARAGVSVLREGFDATGYRNS